MKKTILLVYYVWFVGTGFIGTGISPRAMTGLNDLAFGRIKVREILGAEPDLDAIRQMLESEMKELTAGLEGRDVGELDGLKIRQICVHREVNSRPGAMALPQRKIRLFSDFSSQYIDAIEKRLSWHRLHR